MFSVHNNKYVPLIDNPVQERNSHKFRPNQFKNSKDICGAVDILKNLDNSDTHKTNVMYVHSFYYHLDKHKDWHISIDKIIKSNCPLIIVRLPKQYVLYHGLAVKRAFGSFDRQTPHDRNQIETFEINIKEFFHEASDKWKNKNLTNIYDKREFIALNFRPFDTTQYDKMFNMLPHDKTLHLVSIDVWENLDNTIHDIMKFLNIQINETRFEKWSNIYNEWKKLHTKRVMWCWYYDQIIEYIINGFDMDLTRFDLDIFQEATIQHTMLYKYDLNFKTFELDKFVNTKQLHSLLEPNHHPLQNYEYN